MKNLMMTTAMLLAMCAGAYSAEPSNCSNQTVQNKVMELSRNYINKLANERMNLMFAMVGKGDFALQAIRTDGKSENVTICEAELHVKVDPKYVEATQGAIKAEPILPTTYSVQMTDDGQSFYVKLLALEL